MRVSRSLRQIAFLIASAVSVPYLAFTQIDTGSIIGTVQDPSGAAVVNAALTATNQDTGVVITSKPNGSGEYQFSGVRPGVYTVKATAPGFSAQIVKDVRIDVQTRALIDFSLKVGQVSDVLEIHESTPLLQTQAADVGGVVQESQIRDLP